MYPTGTLGGCNHRLGRTLRPRGPCYRTLSEMTVPSSIPQVVTTSMGGHYVAPARDAAPFGGPLSPPSTPTIIIMSFGDKLVFVNFERHLQFFPPATK